MSKKKAIITIIALIIILLVGSAVYVAMTWNDGKKSERICTTYDNKAEEQCIEDYIGLTQQKAINKAKQYKYNPKIMSIDGKEQPLHDDRGSIIYLEITDGRVSKAYFEE